VGLVLLALLWIGGEVHYRGCIDAAKAAYPVVKGSSLLNNTSDANGAKRRARIAGCSRVPF
jgi:hypothetical protein